MPSESAEPILRRWRQRARSHVGDLSSRYLHWAEQNPEGVARLRLWAGDLAQAQPPDGLLGILRALFLGVAPPNWHALPPAMSFQADKLICETGLCLVWVPEADVIAELVGSTDKQGRDLVLVRNSDRILNSIECVLAEVIHPQLGLLRESAFEAVDSARAGYFGASQALSATLLTRTLEEHYGFSFKVAREAFDAEPPATAGLWSHRRALVQRAVQLSILNSHLRSAEGGFNRHITGHGSDLTHLSEPHALQAVMLVGGTLRELQEVYRVAEFGFSPTPKIERSVTARLAAAPSLVSTS